MSTLENQSRLKHLGFDPGPLDGLPGPRTTAAVRAFQKEFGLVADGIIGPQTHMALVRATSPAHIQKPEPDKSAMNCACPPSLPGGHVAILPPPNLRDILFLDTARPIHKLIWHCAATPEGEDFSVHDIRGWHRARGFSDVGYHFVVYRDGRIILGRPIGQIGAHVSGRNTGSIGCCYIGGVAADRKTAKDTRTDAQRSSMLWLNRQLVTKFPTIRTIAGHNEFAAKACPSFLVRNDPLGEIRPN